MSIRDEPPPRLATLPTPEGTIVALTYAQHLVEDLLSRFAFASPYVIEQISVHKNGSDTTDPGGDGKPVEQ